METKPRICKMNGRQVDIALKSKVDPGPDAVYWSPRGNSYVLVKAHLDLNHQQYFLTPWGQPVTLVSINGIGELRWTVRPYEIIADLGGGGNSESILAARHFSLLFGDTYQVV